MANKACARPIITAGKIGRFSPTYFVYAHMYYFRYLREFAAAGS